MSENRIDRDSRDHLRDLARRTLEGFRRLNEAAAGRTQGSGAADPVTEAGEVLQDVVNQLRRSGGSERSNGGNRGNGSEQ